MIYAKESNGATEHLKKTFGFSFCSKVLQGGLEKSLKVLIGKSSSNPLCSKALLFRAGIPRVRAHSSLCPMAIRYGAFGVVDFVGFYDSGRIGGCHA